MHKNTCQENSGKKITIELYLIFKKGIFVKKQMIKKPPKLLEDQAQWWESNEKKRIEMLKEFVSLLSESYDNSLKNW